jgi:CTD small phosphatase-like protein 2
MASRRRLNALVSEKAPKPTTFSNQRSNHYLNSIETAPAAGDLQTPSSRPITPRPPSNTPKFLINLEDLVKIETHLERLLTGLGSDLSSDCEEWWRLSSQNAISQIDHLYRDPETKKVLKHSLIMEILAVSLAQFSSTGVELTPVIEEQLKGLLFYVHQNFLTLVYYALHRLPADYAQNVRNSQRWAYTLQSLIYNKRQSQAKKNENLEVLRRNNEALASLMKVLGKSLSENCKTKDFKTILLSSLQVLKQVESIDVDMARNIMKKALEPPSPTSSLVCSTQLNITNLTESFEEDVELPVVQPPYLPPLEDESRFTLVLDLDETLVHYYETEDEGHYLVRPGCDTFLEEMSHHYEIVIFTAALQDYADWVLDHLDSSQFITYRLYRQHAIPDGNVYLKDLSRIGRNIAKTIIVDNVAENFQLQPDNGILIRSWFDDMSDTALEELAPLLKGEK